MAAYLKLAITRIGDLLLRDKITQDKDGNTIADINLVIPDYQRPYKWTAKNAIQLLDDIVDAKTENKETYRVGTLIPHQEREAYNIVDGQQRTITFSLLLKALGAKSISFLDQPLANNPNNIRRVGGDVTEDEVKRMIGRSYDLIKPKMKRTWYVFAYENLIIY